MDRKVNITKLFYQGDVDEAGRPHGRGKLVYVVEKDPRKERRFADEGNIKYEGEFEHGKRHGDGDLHVLGVGYNPVSEYAWYSEGDYDSCGRLIRPSNSSGSYQQYVPMWYPCFEGIWQDDEPKESRWEEGKLGKITKSDWQYIRLTSYEAVKALPVTFSDKH